MCTAGIGLNRVIASGGDIRKIQGSRSHVGQGNGQGRGLANRRLRESQLGGGERGRRSAAGAAVREDEICNARVPIEAAGGRDVLLGVPERAVVGGIDRHGAVIAPAVLASGLRTRSTDD